MSWGNVCKQEQWLTCPVFLDSALKLAVIPVIVSMGYVQVVPTLGGRCLNTERGKVTVMFNTKVHSNSFRSNYTFLFFLIKLYYFQALQIKD